MINPTSSDQRTRRNPRLRSLLADPQYTYEAIGKKLGLTRQRVSQLAQRLGVDVRERRSKRRATRPPTVMNPGYPPEVAAVIRRIKRTGASVESYLSRGNSGPNLWWKSQINVLVNSQLCTIRLSRRYQFWPGGAHYFRFHVPEKKPAKLFIFASTEPPLKVYIVPASELPDPQRITIREDGCYTRPVICDWKRYENAWQLLAASSKGC